MIGSQVPGGVKSVHNAAGATMASRANASPPVVPPDGGVRMGSESAGDEPYLTLSEAARLAPGRTTPNCIWRWCRAGVLARNGARIRLQHIRVGGKIFTKRSWVEGFFAQVAQTDAAYFDAKAEAAARAAPRDPKYAAPQRQWRSTRPGPVSEEAKRRRDDAQRRREETERELDDEGL